MNCGSLFYFNSILLGTGLSMDAFSVSVANGLSESQMCRRKLISIAGTFAFFQALMPMLGWTCVHTVVKHLKVFEKFIPYIALFLLIYIGGKMICDSITANIEIKSLNSSDLLLQGIATSIDALSVGFTIADYDLMQALTCSFIISSVTFAICAAGVGIGKTIGGKISGQAEFLGGCILIFIGIEIFITNIL